MLDYIKGIIFLIVFITFLSALGKRLHKSSEFYENLIFGFVIYTCFQFFGGFIAQQFRLPWYIYQIYMIVLLILLTILISYKNKITFDKSKVFQHFRSYGLIYALALIFVILAIMNIQYQWNANNVDDGYYLNKIRMAPYVANYTDYNFAAGLESSGSIIRNVNTFEIEAAFFAQVLGMDASIFAKVFLSYFNYCLVLFTILWFFKTMFKTDRGILKGIALTLIPVLFFGIYQELLVNFKVIYLQDSWQFNTAMWYGSTLVRSIGLYILILPFIDKSEHTIKDFIIFGLISIALMSKASQAFPVIVIVGIILVFKMLLSIRNKKIVSAAALLLLLILILIPVTPQIETRLGVVNTMIGLNFSTVVIKISIFLVFISFMFGFKNLRRWNIFLIVFGIFVLVPRINTLFAYISFYDFVAARTITLFLFCLIITAILDLYFIMNYVIVRRKVIILLYTCVGCVLVGIPLVSIQRNLGITNTYNTLLSNPKLIPDSTLALGEKLEEISNARNEKLYVLMPMWLVLDGTPHPASTMLRYNSFDIVSVGTLARYGDLTDDSVFNNYSQNEQDIIEKYHSGEDRDDKKLSKLLEQYPINCIVVHYDDVSKHLQEEFDYKVLGKIGLSDQVHSYYILMKE